VTTGDPCPRCGAPVQVTTTRIVGDFRVRYLGCRRCGHSTGDKLLVPIAYAPRRVRTTSRIAARA